MTDVLVCAAKYAYLVLAKFSRAGGKSWGVPQFLKVYHPYESVQVYPTLVSIQPTLSHFTCF